MNTETPPAGYVPGAADADGSEDPVPTSVLQSTGAASAGKPRLDAKGKPIIAAESNDAQNHAPPKKAPAGASPQPDSPYNNLGKNEP